MHSPVNRCWMNKGQGFRLHPSGRISSSQKLQPESTSSTRPREQLYAINQSATSTSPDKNNPLPIHHRNHIHTPQSCQCSDTALAPSLHRPRRLQPQSRRWIWSQTCSTSKLSLLTISMTLHVILNIAICFSIPASFHVR